MRATCPRSRRRPSGNERSTARSSSTAETTESRTASRAPRFRSVYNERSTTSTTGEDREGWWSFEELADAVSVRGLGVLVGWHRSTPPPSTTGVRKQAGRVAGQAAGGAIKPEINPPNKRQKVPWAEGDALIIVQTRTSVDASRAERSVRV